VQTWITHSESETSDVAAHLAASLPPGAVILLYGDLGAGKTAFVRGLATGLGVDPDEVSSPTFTLVQEYRGVRTLYHVDLYRLASGEIGDIGLDDLMNGEGITAIEWAEKLTDELPGAIRVTIADGGDDDRQIIIEQ
jgi:tRNA threonylcarbamoyladenosine biosynthesis protein TsaE